MFNRSDDAKKTGPLTFDDTSPASDYHLVERIPGHPHAIYPLGKAG